MRKHNEEKSKSRMEAEGMPREAESFRKDADSRACQNMQNSEMKS
jgi:hypothetical protein